MYPGVLTKFSHFPLFPRLGGFCLAIGITPKMTVLLVQHIHLIILKCQVDLLKPDKNCLIN